MISNINSKGNCESKKLKVQKQKKCNWHLITIIYFLCVYKRLLLLPILTKVLLRFNALNKWEFIWNMKVLQKGIYVFIYDYLMKNAFLTLLGVMKTCCKYCTHFRCFNALAIIFMRIRTKCFVESTTIQKSGIYSYIWRVFH